jgi:hypothetical protein
MSSIRKLAHLPLLPDGSILNIGGTDFPTFTVGGKGLLFDDGTSTNGSSTGGFSLTLQQAYQNSLPDGNASALLKLLPGKNLTISNTDGSIPYFSINGETGDISISGKLSVENVSFTDFYNEFYAHIAGEEWLRHYASDINILPIPQLEDGTTNVQQALEQLSSKLVSQSSNKSLTAGYEHTQDIAAQTWTITHNSNTMRAHVTVYNEEWEQIIPEKIKITDANTITITLSEPMAGKAMVYLMYLGAVDENTDDCIITYPILPCESNSVRGLVGGYEYIQVIQSASWEINHNANIKRANVTVYDESWEQILPDKVKIINNDVISVTFTKPVSGRALIMLF